MAKLLFLFIYSLVDALREFNRSAIPPIRPIRLIGISFKFKVELVYNCMFETRSQARRIIFEYIEVFYNRIRIHSAMGTIAQKSTKRKEK